MARSAKRDPVPEWPRWLVVTLFVLGGALAAPGLVWLVTGYVQAATVGLPQRNVYGGALFALLLAAVPLWIAELMRRARWQTPDRGYRAAVARGDGETAMRIARHSIWRGGNVVLVLRQIPVGAVLLWALIPILFWVALVPVPVLAELSGAAFVDASDDFWMITGFFAFIAASTVGAIAGSLVRRAVFARARSEGRVAPEARREWWRVVSGQMRLELFLTAIGMGFLGITPLVLDDPTAVAVLAAIGLTLVLAGVLLATQAWRSGEEPGYAESVR